MHHHALQPETDRNIGLLMEDEQWCVCYLFTLRWPDGFICPFCRQPQPAQLPDRTIVCRFCRKVTTVTSGTLLHGSKKGLHLWFRAIWWLIDSAPEFTAKGLQERLGYTSYQTAWTWMGKLRLAMEIFVGEPSSGTVVVGEGVFPKDRAMPERQRFLISVESIAEGRMSGKVQMSCVDSVDGEAVAGFIREHIRPGSSVVVSGREPFTAPVDPARNIYITDPDVIDGPVLHDLARRFSTWYARRKYRPVNRRHAQGQLNEFCFIEMAHLQHPREELFERMLAAVIAHGPEGERHLGGIDRPEWGAA